MQSSLIWGFICVFDQVEIICVVWGKYVSVQRYGTFCRGNTEEGIKFAVQDWLSVSNCRVVDSG